MPRNGTEQYRKIIVFRLSVAARLCVIDFAVLHYRLNLFGDNRRLGTVIIKRLATIDIFVFIRARRTVNYQKLAFHAVLLRIICAFFEHMFAVVVYLSCLTAHCRTENFIDGVAHLFAASEIFRQKNFAALAALGVINL